jgi:cephalosporin-C deacetylase-like acetyl esterase
MQRVIREQEPVKPSTRIRTSQVGQLPWRGRPALARRGHPARDADSGRARDNEQGQDALATGRCTPYQQVRGDLDWIVMKALEKTRDRRYDNASALAMDVQRHLKNEPILAGSPGMFYRLQKFVRRHRSHLATATVVTVLAVGLVITAVKYRRTSRLAWAKGEALPRIVELVEAGEIAPAFALVQKVQKVIPNDPTLIDLWPRISKAYSIDTTPPGVRVFYREYADQNGPWRSLGQSPLRIILANGIYRWKLEKQGFNTHECVTDRSLSVRLCPSDLAREMVWIEGWKIDSWHAELLRDSFAHGTIAEVPAFLMDKYEVTNEQFQAFVDAGGYTNAEYWEGLAFIKDDRQLSWQEAMAKFRDQTGQPGPATWEHGTYPQGRERHPVSGVGWFEAMAYARFSGKSLPTLYHWRAAACTEESTVIVPHSNFNTGGTAVVGSFPGTGHTGLYDMAGNVKEWCFNATDDSGSQHVIKGASYAEQTYNFTGVELRSPWNRSPVNGFRCVKYPEGDIHSFAEGLLAPVPLGSPERDYSTSEPCSDEEYRFILRQFEYDRLPLDANVVRVDDSAPLWREETITFNATYGREQVIAHLFLPKAVEPPYQVVVYWPDNRALEKRPFTGLEQPDFTEMILQSGRALMFPVYQGTYERSYGQYLDWFTEPHATADWIIHVCQDMCRSIDYLETRHDIDEKKIAYYGVCVGGICGPMALVIEDRFKTGILVGGGFPNAEVTAATPAIDPLHHAPRVKTPVLMINSEQDPLAVSQLPMYRFLGTPDEHKRYNVYPDGSSNGDDFRRDVAGWLDRYLGPVE